MARNSFLIGQYVETHSAFHLLDPRTKIVSLLFLMLGLLLSDTIVGYVVATVVVVLFIIWSRIAPIVFIKGFKPLLLILLFTFFYNLFFTKGEVLWSFTVVQITKEGLYNAVMIVWRIKLLVLLASLLTLTTKPLHLAQGLERLMSPLGKLGVPVEQFALMIVIAIRFIPTILEELERILLAQKARGFHIEQLPLAKRLFAYVPIVVPLLFTTIQRAEQLSFAIDARGYGNGKNRTRYVQLRFAKRDMMAFGFVGVYMVGMLWIV